MVIRRPALRWLITGTRTQDSAKHLHAIRQHVVVRYVCVRPPYYRG